jgi:hypothetical protein
VQLTHILLLFLCVTSWKLEAVATFPDATINNPFSFIKESKCDVSFVEILAHI